MRRESRASAPRPRLAWPAMPVTYVAGIVYVTGAKPPRGREPGEGTPAACTWRAHKQLRKAQGAAEGIHLCQTLRLALFVMSTYCTFAHAQVFQAIPFYDSSSMHTSILK